MQSKAFLCCASIFFKSLLKTILSHNRLKLSKNSSRLNNRVKDYLILKAKVLKENLPIFIRATQITYKSLNSPISGSQPPADLFIIFLSRPFTSARCLKVAYNRIKHTKLQHLSIYIKIILILMY